MHKLGKYRLIAEVARGGMGIVYLAATEGPGNFRHLVIVKELKPEIVTDAHGLQMFLEEARLAALLSHANIVQTIEVGSEDGRHFIVMEYLEGRSLHQLHKRRSSRFTLEMELLVLCEVLRGLEHAHSLSSYSGTPLGIVHRDVTPHNIFVTYDAQVKLLDFGVAKARDSSFETRAGTLKGKPAYMAPEQVAGQSTPQVDVFAVGVMLWEAMAGRRMWPNQTDFEILARLMKGMVPSIREAKSDAPEELLRICDRAVAVEPSQRYASAAEMLHDLEAYLSHVNARATIRDLGKVVSELFAEERQRIRHEVERHIAASTREDSNSSAPVPALQRARMDSATESGGSGARVSLGNSSGALHHAAVAFTNADIPAPKKARRTAIMVGAIGLVAIVLFALARPKREAKSAAVSEANAGPSKVESTPAAAAAPAPLPPATTAETAPMTVRATPPSATIRVNGKPEANPAMISCSPTETLTVSAAADGFVGKAQDIACKPGQTATIALSNARSAPPVYVRPQAAAPKAAKPEPVAAAPAAPPSQPAPTSTDVSPSGGRRPNIAIDTSSPYGAQ